MNKLKVIVSKQRPFALTDFSIDEEVIESLLNEAHLITVLSGAYLHGKVEDYFGYDICMCLNAEECVENTNYKDGIYEVEVLRYPNPCTAYLWTSNLGQPRGLIIDSSDDKAREYAKSCYAVKEEFL